MRVLIIGCGYLGLRTARRWLARGDSVSALTRSADKANDWKQLGIHPIAGDVLNPESLQTLPQADLCLYAVGYDRSQSASKHDVYVAGLQNVLSVLKSRSPRVLYISSTSVYGQETGEWVNENSPCNPISEGGKICLEAESLVEKFAQEDALKRSAVVLRLAGIYGPNRMLARKEQLLKQTPLSGNPLAWLNLIHVDDAASAIIRLSETWPASPFTRRLLCDAEPVQRREFYSHLAELYGAPPPLFTGDDPGLNKRCDSSTILDELSLQLTYPTFREGLRSGNA